MNYVMYCETSVGRIIVGLCPKFDHGVSKDLENNQHMVIALPCHMEQNPATIGCDKTNALLPSVAAQEHGTMICKGKMHCHHSTDI